MSGAAAQTIAERLIRLSCRRLPADERAERRREWSAELPAILEDTSVRLPVLRAVRALRYSAGVSRAARSLRRAGDAGARARGSGRGDALPARHASSTVRLAVGGSIWLIVVVAVVAFLRAFPERPVWPMLAALALGVAFDAFCLADIARASQVRHLPKWAWALACLVQTPAGGIIYLSIGRSGRARPTPPTSAHQP